MEVYIDKDFVLNYWAVSENEATFQNFENEFLKQSNLYTIITNFASYNEVLECEEASLFFNDIVQESRVADIVFLPELINEDCFESCISNGGIKLFLMEFETEKCKQLEQQYGYRFISTNQVKDKWAMFEKYKFMQKSIALPVDEKDDDVFNTWDDLKVLSRFPNNSIVISDKYILSDKSHSQLKENILPLLEALIPEDYKGTLSVTILSEEILSQKKGQSIKENAITVHQLLNRTFARYKELKFRFSIVKYDKCFNSGDQPNIHDRHIYMNYFTIKSGVGFNLYNKGKRKIEDSEVAISFNFQRYSMKTISGKIEGLKQYLNKMSKTEKLGSFKFYPEKFKNNLLD